MKKLLLAGLAGAAAVAAASPAAYANPTDHWAGPGCGFLTLSDGTDGPQTKWDGEIHAGAVATSHATNTPNPTASITIECELRINGATPGTIVFSASGTGAAGGGAQFSFHADPDDIVTMCDLVTVNQDFHKDCGNATTTPIIPQPVQDVLDQTVWPTVDGHVCAITKSWDGGPLDNPPAFDIRPDGDVYINGILFYDCPPYEGGA